MLFAYKWHYNIYSACSSRHKMVMGLIVLFSAISDDLFADICVNGVDSDAKVMICVTSV